MIPHGDVSDLEWFFNGADHEDNRSEGLGGLAVGTASLGEQLERAAIFHRDSTGEVIPPSGGVHEVLHEDEEGRLHMLPTAWPWMYVKKPAPAVPSALAPAPGTATERAPDRSQVAAQHQRQAERIDRRTRLRARLARVSSTTYDALRALYGARGLLWANDQPDPKARRPARGRAWVLLPLTPRGQREREAAGSPPVDPWLRELSERSPPWLDVALTQAERLHRDAARDWLKARKNTVHDDD